MGSLVRRLLFFFRRNRFDRDLKDELKEAGAVLLGVSPDDVASHARFRDKYQLNFPLLADPDHALEVARCVPDRRHRIGRNASAAMPCLADLYLDLEPGVNLPPLGPDLSHFGTGIAVDHRV